MLHSNTTGLRALLAADLHRQRELFGQTRRLSGPGLWLRMLSPRFAPVLLYRLAYSFDASGFKWIAKIFSMCNVVLFGIEIATVCKIGPGLFFPHTHGTVIGAVSVGANAVIYQGVTLGAKDLDFTYDEHHRPIVGDGVVLGAGAKVLGGVVLGDNVIVAANAVVLNDVPHNVVVGGIPAVVLKERNI